MKLSEIKQKLKEAQQKAEADLAASLEQEQVSDTSPKKKERINTAKVLNSNYFNGDGMGENYFQKPAPMAVSPLVSEQYDFAVTDDIVLLNERKDTAEKIFKIYKASPYNGMYMTSLNVMKVPKDKIFEVFHYMRSELLKVKPLSAMETVLAINEFFDFSYEYIYDKVLSPQMKADILNDYYKNMGMKDRIDEEASEPLF